MDFLTTQEYREQHFHADYGVRFYAGAPLVTSRKYAIGTICLLDTRFIEFGEEGLTLLEAFARAAVGRLETLGALERKRAAGEERARCARRLRELGEALKKQEDSERALRESEERSRALLRYGPDFISVLEADGTVRYTSPSVERVLGYRPDERVGIRTLDDVHPEDAGRASRAFAEALARPGFTPPLEYRVRHADGSWRYLESIGNNLLDDADARGIVVGSRDVTARKQTEKELDRLASFPELNPNPVVETDPTGGPTYSNPAAERLFPDLLTRGSDHPALVGLGPAAGGLGDDGEPVTREVEVNGAFYRQAILRVPGGGNLRLYMMDITEHKALEESLVRQALHDSLTGLPNRTLFVDRLSHALARTERREEKVAVLYIDLDDFKAVNDSLGHEVGDRLLAAVGERLRTCLRPADTVARLGGDEFTVLLEEDDLGEAKGVAERIVHEMQAPFPMAGRELFVTTSLGLALGAVGDCPEDLLRVADLAMYRAKERGKARYEVSSESPDPA